MVNQDNKKSSSDIDRYWIRSRKLTFNFFFQHFNISKIKKFSIFSNSIKVLATDIEKKIGNYAKSAT